MGKVYFVCKNKNCHPDRWGGEIIEISEDEAKYINCPHCDQKYEIREDMSTLTVFDSAPMLIESLKDVNSLQEKFTNKDLFITKLHIKDITDSENFKKTMSYKQCFIEELVIENIDLSTSCFPLAFDECVFLNISISNCKLKDDGKKDYWGPSTFFGISFNNSKVFGKIEIDDFFGSILIKSCKIDETINILHSQIKFLHLINNDQEVEIELVNSTIESKVRMDALANAEDGSVPVPVQSKNFTETIQVKDLGKKKVRISDKHIENLIFPDVDKFLSPVIVSNCTINKINFDSKEFNQNITFINCQFLSPVSFSKITFHKQLILEANNFYHDCTLSEIHVGDDLHLSYSTFHKNLFLNESTISGYLTMHQAEIRHIVYIDHCKSNRNIALVNVSIGQLSIQATDVHSHFFVTSCLLNAEFKISNSTIGGDLDFNKSTFNSEIEILNNKIQADFRCTDCLIINTLKLTLNDKIENIIIAQTTFYEDVAFTGNKFSAIYFFSNRILDEFMLSDCTVNSSSLYKNNILYGSFSQYRSSLVKQKISNNLFLNKLDFDDSKIDSVQLTSNKTNYLFINKVNCESFESSYDFIETTKIYDLFCSKLLRFEGCAFKYQTQILQSRFDRQFHLNSCIFNWAAFITENRINTFKIDSCQFESNACLFKNNISDRLEVDSSSFSETFDLNNTYVGGIASISAVDFKKTLILDSAYFDKRINFLNSKTNNISLRDASLNGFNLPDEWDMKMGRLTNYQGHPILVDEQLLRDKKSGQALTLQMLQAMLLDHQNEIKHLKKNWYIIKSKFIEDDDIPEEIKLRNTGQGDGKSAIPDVIKEKVNAVLEYAPFLDQLLKEKFSYLFYGFYTAEELEDFSILLTKLKLTLYQSSVGGDEIDILARFCTDLERLITLFQPTSHPTENKGFKEEQLKPLLYERLQDQYLIIKEVFGSNGDLGYEDKAYFRWMHYKNLYDFQISKWYQKPEKMIKWLVFEQIFGWGVDLFRIFGSTILLVLVFSGIYWIGGQLNPQMSIRWDDVDIPISMLNYGNIILLTFQTTFAAFMGDWSPAGLGPMKIWMTINAVIGVLLVAFLIGAYGRKMLR